MWLVSDRQLGCNVAQVENCLRYWRYECHGGWQRSDLDALLAAEDPAMITTVFVHGNRIPSCEAFTKGWSAYRSLVRCADERPVRFVIWSWPSDPVRGLREDAQLKAARTNYTGYYLAWFLDRLHPDTPVALWGHSFGARAVTGALHLLGGGEICGHVLERVHPERSPMQVALLAAAVDNTWLAPGHSHGQAMSQTASLLLVNNRCDMLLKRYHMIYGRRSCREALGYTGLWCGCLSADEWCKIAQIDACCDVGRRHMFSRYIESSCLMARIRPALLFESSPATVVEGPQIVAATDAEAVDAVAVETDAAETDKSSADAAG